jgi:PST family polysaccharide transporter
MGFRTTAMFQKITPNLHKVLVNTSWLVGEKVFRMSLSLLIGVWVIRYLGPQQYGMYSYALAIVGLLVPLSRMGLPKIAVRNLVCDPSARDKVLGTAFILEVIGGTAVIPLSILISFLFRSDEKLVLLIVGIISISELLRSFEVIDFWFSSKVQAKYIAIANIISFSIGNLIKAILLLFHASLIYFIAIYTLEFAIMSITFILFYTWKVGSIRNWIFSFGYAKQMLSDGWPLIFSGFVIMIYMKSDQIMIAQMIGDRAVGIYAAAARIAEMWYFVPVALVNSISPSIIQARQNGLGNYHEKLSRFSNILVVLAYFFSIVISIFSPFIVGILYGVEYAESSMILSLYVWSGCFVVLGLIRTTYATAENLTYIPFISTLSGAIVNVGLNIILISKYGAVGAALSTLIAQAIASYLSSFFFTQTRELFFDHTRALLLTDFLKTIKAAAVGFLHKFL